MEDDMTQLPSKSNRSILPVILHVTLGLILWTLGVSMNVSASPANEHRVVYNFSVERAKVEDLQRWVNAGHDSWCRDPQLVASASLRRILPDSGGIELASLPVQLEHTSRTSAVYTVHSLDGQTTYRITLRRYRWLLPVAGSFHKMTWVPERAEILTRGHQPLARASNTRAVV